MTESPLTWSGQLKPQQVVAATAVRKLAAAKKNQLLWAVTGAGKTEILYPALAWALQQGWRVAWASPRVDVCLELAPRLARAFAGVSQAVLHGKQEQPYTYRQLTICTTHQLLRFQAAFDWLIVDEVDAFPLTTSPMLQRAVKQAQKPSGSHIFLTATPGPHLQKLVAQRKIAVTYVPLRYHGYLLPQMMVHLSWQWRQHLLKGRLPGHLVRQLRGYQQIGQRFLLFVPHVADLAPIAAALAQAGVVGGVTVHAADPERTAKVQAMRDERCQFLVTTTILERGVTFPNVAVVILGGDEAVFSTAALVQIAGRAGRHAAHPRGEVTCYCQSQSRTIQQARAMIGHLNRQGRQQGGQ
nr:helicase-related protein [Levilactobacillus tongjiangensis]